MEEFECIVCCELPIVPMETSCCGTIICEDCGKQLKDVCPNRCNDEPFSLQRNRFVERKLKSVKTKCAFCDYEASRGDMERHMQSCQYNWDKIAVYNEKIHSCILYKMNKKNRWQCDGKFIVDGGCEQGKKSKLAFDGGNAWYC